MVPVRRQGTSEVGRNGKGSSSPRARRVGGCRRPRGNARAACSKEQCLERHCLDGLARQGGARTGSEWPLGFALHQSRP